MKTTITTTIILVLVLLSMGCSTSLSLQARQTDVTSRESDIKGCKFLGEVKAGWVFASSAGYYKKVLRNRAAELGADVVLFNYNWTPYITQHGQAYDCNGRYKGATK